jgi:hypothetical protein
MQALPGARMTTIIRFDREFRKRAFARRWLERGDANKYISHACDEIQQGDKVVLVCRVSTCGQNRSKNLTDQEAHLRQKMDRLGANVVGTVNHEGSGCDPSWLSQAATMAKKHGAKLLAETTDRLVRNPLYHSAERPNLQARESDLQDLHYWTCGVSLLTDLPPNASPSDVRGYQRRRGQAMKGNRGGRPLNRKWKARRLARIVLAQEMRRDGLSLRGIAQALNDSGDGFDDVTTMTVYNWLHRAV